MKNKTKNGGGNSKRYYLHRRIKKKGFKYSAYKRTVFIPYNDPCTDLHVNRLRDEFNYNIQLEII